MKNCNNTFVNQSSKPTLKASRFSGFSCFSWLRETLSAVSFLGACALTVSALGVMAGAGAEGARVRRGNVSFSQDGNRLIVRASNGAIIEYDRLSIEAGQIMQFIQPGSTSRVLNRVTGSELTRIDGTLLSNGIVYFVNPQGFRIGNGAIINVGGFFAAAGAMSDADFRAGRDKFTNLAGKVINEGAIHAQSVALVGQYVANRGTIDVDDGVVAMAAGDSVYLQKGTGPVMVTVSRSAMGADGSGAGTESAISNTGTIDAGNGSVSMSSGDFYALAMDLSGTIIGKSITARGGQGGVVAVNGTLDASNAAGRGGKIDIFGERVGLFGDAFVTASGSTGGGNIRIGGDYLGTNEATAPHADRTYIGADARVEARATQSGNGGRVIVWSDEYTGFFGTIDVSAAGSGKGGFVETSSHDNLQAFGSVNAASALGAAGLWLLDPSNVLITNATANGSFAGGNPDVFNPSADNATVDAATISATLSAGTSVTILTASAQAQAGNITMTTGITMNAGGAATLTLTADGSISLSADISATALNNLNVVLNAGTTVTLFNAITTQAGDLTIVANGAVNAPGVMNVGGNTTVTAGALNTVTFNNGNDFFGGSVSIVSASNVLINDANGLSLGASTISGTFDVSVAAGNIANTGALLVTGAATFTADGIGANITLGNAGNNFSSTVGFNGVGGLANVTVVDLSAFEIGTSNFSGNLSITAGGAITQGGALTIGGTTTASAAGFDVTLNNAANNFTGAVSTTGANVTIVDSSGLNLGASTVSVNFAATASAGDITNTGALLITGSSTFTASALGASISVNNAANNFTGTVAFAGAGGLANVTVVDLSTFDVQALTLSGNLSVTSGGAITDSGALAITGTTNASAAGFDVTLDDVGNNFGGAVSTTGANVTIVDSSGLNLGASTVSVNFAATATAGNITNSGAQLVTGNSTFTADGLNAIIEIDNPANNFTGIVSFVGAAGLGSVLLADLSAFDIQALTLSGDLDVSAGGAITNSGALLITGVTFATAAGFDVTLNNVGNNFTGAVSTTGANVTLRDLNAIVLGASTVTGNLAVTSAGNVTQTGVLTVTGTTTLTPGAANDVTLNLANEFTGAVSVTGGSTNVSVTDASGLNLGAITASGNLNATATTGDITNTGALLITGLSSFTASAAAANITVANGGNDFGGAVSFAGVGGLNDVTVFDLSGFDIGASTLGGNLSITAAGAITNSGALAITGTTTASAAGFDVTLNNAGNNFGGAVSTTGANVTIVDSNGLNLGASTASVNFAATATAGNITNTGALAITGASTFTASALGATISVNNAANNFTGTVAFAGAGGLADVTVVDLTAFDIQALTLSGNLSVTSGGAITNSGALAITGTTTASAAGFDVTLNNAGNNFGGAVSTTGANVTIVDSNGLNLGASTASVNFAATATAGNITNTGALAITGASTFTASALGATISVNNAANNFTGTVAFAGAGGLADVTVVDLSAFDIQALTLSGNLSVTSGGAITNSGALAITGTTTASAAGFDVTLNNAGNNFGGAVSTTGANVTIVDSNGLNLGASTASVNFAATATAGNITNTGALAITGVSTFTASAAAANITVANGGNDFTGAVSFVGAGGLNDVSVFDLSAFDIGAASLGGNLSITASGAITNSGALVITGTTTASAAGFDVTLNNVGNNFGGAVSSTGANVTLRDLNAIVLGASTVTSNLAVTSAGNVTQTGALSVTGTTTLTPGAANDVTLNLANQFGGAVSVTGGATNVSVTDASGFDLGAITASNNLNATATTGNITNTGALLITGVSTFTAANGATISVDNNGNNFGGAVAFVASAGTLANVTVGDLSAFDLQALTLTANLVVFSGGDVTDSGALNIGGTTNVTANGSAVTLNQVTNFGGLVTVDTSGTAGVGGNITLTSTTSFSVESLTSDGFDNPAGAGFAGGNIILDAGAGNSVTLTANGFITTTGGDATGAFAGGDGGDVTFLVNAIIGGGTTIDLAGGAGTPNGTAGTLTFFSTVLNGISTFAGSVNLGNVTVIADSDVTVTGTLTLGSVTGGGFNLVLSVEDLALTGNINNLASLTIENVNTAGAINLMSTAVGALNIDNQAEWNFIQSDVLAVTLGNDGIAVPADGYTGAMTIAAAWENDLNLTIDYLLGGGGSLTLNGDYTGLGTFTLNGSGNSFNINANMTNMSLTYTDTYVITTSVVFTATNGNIIFATNPASNEGLSSSAFGNNFTFRTTAAGGTITLDTDLTTHGGDFVNNITILGTLANPTAAIVRLSGEMTGQLLVNRAASLSLSSNSTPAFIANTLTADSIEIGAGIQTNLTADSTFVTTGDITFGGNLDGASALTMDAGIAGDIFFNGSVGSTTDLGVVTITNAHNVAVGNDAADVFEAARFVQITGAGTTTLTAAVAVTGGDVAVSNDTISVLDTIGTAAGGAVTLNAEVTNLTIAAAGDISAGGDVNLTAAGGISTAGDVTTTGDAVNFNSATTLTGGILIGTAGGSVQFVNALDGAQTLGVTAVAGGVTFSGAVGAGTRLGAITITSAGTVLASQTVRAASFTQATGSVSTTFTGLVDLTGVFDFQGEALSINGVGQNVFGTSVAILNTGLFTTAAGANIAVGTSLAQTGVGLNSLGGNITSASAGISFLSGVTLTNGVLMTTGGGAGDDMLFGDALAGGGNTLGITAGAGDVTFVGVASNLGAVTINAAANVTMTTFTAASLNQAFAGTGTFNNTGVLTATTGAVTINSATVTIGNNIVTTAAGAAGDVSVTGTTGLSGNVTTGGGDVTFNSPTALGAAVALGSGGGNIRFASTLAGATNTLGVTAGAGNVTFSDTASGLGAVTINAAANVSMTTFTAASLNQAVAGTGTFNNTGVLTTTTGAVTISSAIVDINANIVTTAAFAAGTVSVTGATDLGGNVNTQGGSVTFAAATTLSGAARSINTTNGDAVGANISFSNTLNGGTALALTAGTGGDVTFTGAVGTGARLGAITIASADNVTAAAIRAASFGQSTGAGTTTFNGAQNYDGAVGLGVVATVIALNESVTTTGGGAVQLDAVTTLTIAAAGDINSDGAVNLGGLTGIFTAGDVTTSNADVQYANNTTLNGGIVIASTGGDVSFGNMLTGANSGVETLEVTAGIGNVTFGSTVGATALGAVTINAANNVSMGAGFTAASLNQAVAGTGTFNNLGVLTATTGAITINSAVVDINQAIVTTAALAAGTVSVTGATDLGGDVNTQGGSVTFASATTLSGAALSINTTNGDAVGASISFSNTLNGGTALALTAGTGGNIDFDGVVGTVALGAVTINAANNVTMTTFTAASLNQAFAGTGTFNNTGVLTASAAAGVTISSATVTIANNIVTSFAGADVSVTGTTGLGGNVTTNGGDVSFNSPTTLTTGVALSSTGGNIRFFNTLTGTQTLGITAGAGNVTFTGVVGTTRLGAVTITSAATVLASDTFTAASFTQAAGSVATTFTGLVDLTTVFDFTGTALNINGAGANVIGTTMEVTNAGLFTTANGANLGVGNDFLQNGAGLNSIGGNIASTNDGIAFTTGVTLTAGSLMTTGAGVFDDVTFTSTVNGAQTLGITAGAGDVTFGGAVGGGARLGAVTITSAATVDALSTFTAASFTQVAGSVATTFTGLVDLTGAFAFTGNALSVNGAGANVVGGGMTVTNAGLFTTANGANLGVTNAFVQNGAGLNSIGGNIASTNNGITFATGVALTNGVTMTTGLGAGANVTFASTIDGHGLGGQTLGITAGAGNATFTGAAGSAVRLGGVTITSAATVLASSTFTAASFTQVAGSVATTFTGLVNLTNAFDFNGAALNINGVGANVIGTNMEVSNAGLFTTAVGANLSVGTEFVQNAAGVSSIGGNIASTNDGISFQGIVTLTNGVLMSTGLFAGDDVFFTNSVNGTVAGAQTLGITAGAGNVTFSGLVGAVRLGAVTITSAATVLASNTFTAASFTQSAGSVATTFTGLVDLTGAFAFTGNALNVNGAGANAIGTTMDVANAGLFTTANGANLGVGNGLSQFGAGLNSIGGNIASTNDGIAFATGVTLTNGVLMSTGAGAFDDVGFGGTLNGAQTLGITAGLGDVTFFGAVGNTARLGAVTITSAATVDALSTFTAASFTQAAGTVATTFTGLIDLTTVFDFTGNVLTLNGVGTNVIGSTMEVTNAGLFTTANGANLGTFNAFVQNGAGLNSIGGNIVSTNDRIAFATDVTLTNGVLMTTGLGGGADVVFGGTLNGAQTLGITAGAGDVTFTGTVGNAARLGAVTITSAANVSALDTFTAASFTQAAGSVATTFTGLVDLTTVFDFTGTILNVNGAGANVIGTTMDVTNAGLFTTANGANLGVGNAFLQNGAGLNSIGGDIASTNNGITFTTGVTLTAGVLMTTGLGAGDNVLFTTTLDGAQSLGITAGLGNVTFTLAVGAAAPLGAVTISSAATTLASSTFTAASFTQSAGFVATTFAGLVDLTGAFDFTGAALNINFAGANAIGTTMEVTNSGLFTTANGANLGVGNDFVQNGAGLNSIGGNIASTANGIAFATGVTLTAGSLMSTGLGAGNDVTFSSTLNGAQTLGITAGAGNVTFTGTVGNAARLGAVTISSGATVLASNTFTAASFTQAAGSVATTFTGLVDLTGAFAFTGAALNVNGAGSNAVGTAMTVTNAGLFTTANGANLSVGTEFVQNGAGLNSIGGNIASTNDGIAFATGVTLTNGVLMTTGLGAADDVTFSSTLNGAQTLGITAGAGNVTFTGTVGNAARLGAVTITSGATVLASNTFTAASFTQAAGSVATTFTGLVDLTTVFDFTGTALNINGAGANVIGTTMEVTNAGLFTTANGANLGVGNDFLQNGAGLNSIGGNIASTNDGIAFTTGVTLTAGSLMTTGAGVFDDVTFTSTVNGAQTLGITAGAGDVTFGGAVGAGARLGAVTITSAATVDALSTFTAASFTQVAGSVATTFTGLVDLTGAFAFTGNALSVNGAGANVVGAGMTVTNAGLFTTANGANLGVANAFVQNGAGFNSLGGNIASTNNGITFATGVALTNGVTMTTGLGAGANVTFASTIDGHGLGGQTLGITAGLGDVTFTGAAGSAVRLGAVTITSAATVLASSTFTAASFTQVAGSVATTFTGLVNLTNAFDFTGTILNVNGAGANVIGTTMDVTNAGLFTTAIGANLGVGNEFVQDGAGANSIGGNIASTNDGITFGTGVTLTNGVLMTTGLFAGDDVFFGFNLNGTVADTQDLDITAGAGNVTFVNNVGGGVRPGAVTVNSAATVLASGTFNAESFTQVAGTVATTFVNQLFLMGAFDFTGAALSINFVGASTIGQSGVGAMEVTNAGLFTTAIGANLLVRDDFVQNGAGLNSIGGNITSVNDGIAFATGVTLTAGSLMTTGAGAGDDVTFSSTLNGTVAGAQTLGITAGAGNVTFTGTVGNTARLGAVSITSAATVLASNTFTAASFTQAAGSVATTFTGLVDLTTVFDFTGTILNVNGAGANVIGTTMDVTNAGLFTTANGANLGVGNEFVQDGAGANSIGGNIASTADGIAFLRGVTLTAGSLMSTGAGVFDDVTFSSTLDGTVAGIRTLGVTAGAGDVTFTGAVGGTTRLGAVTITSAATVLASDTFTALSFTQSAGSVATTFQGLVDLTTFFDFTGLNLSVNGIGNNVVGAGIGGGTMDVINAGLFTTADGANLVVSNDFVQDGAGLNSIGGDITSTNDGISFATGVTLTNVLGVTMTSGLGVNDNVNFTGSLDGTDGGAQPLSITAGAGNVFMGGQVGSVIRLGAVIITTAADVVAQSTFTAASFLQNAGTGETTFNGLVNLTTAFNFTGNVLNINGPDVLGVSNVVGTTMDVTNAGLFTTAIGANLDVGTNFVQDGAGLNSIGGDITSAAGGIAFLRGVTLTNDVAMVSGGAFGNDVVFSATVDGTVAGGETFTVNAGAAGNATFTGAVGSTVAMGAIAVTGAAINVNGGEVTSSNGTIGMTGAVLLGANTVIDSTDGNLVNGADITFTGTVDGSAGLVVDLTVDAGSAALGGAVTFTGLVGATDALATLTVRSADLTTHFFANVTTVGDQNYFGGVQIDSSMTFRTTDTLGDISFHGAVQSGGALGAQDMTVQAGGNVLFEGNIGEFAQLGTLIVDCGTSFDTATNLGDTISFSNDDPLSVFPEFFVFAESILLNTVAAASDLPAPATVATIFADRAIDFQTDEFAMGQNHKLTVFGDVQIFGTNPFTFIANTVRLGDVTATGNLVVDSNVITLLGRVPGPIVTNTGGTVTDPTVDFVVGGRVFFSVAPVMAGVAGTSAMFSNPTGNVDGNGTLNGYAKTVYPSAITAALITGLQGQALDLSAGEGPSYENPANWIPPNMSFLPSIGLLGEADDSDESDEDKKEEAESSDEEAKKTASEREEAAKTVPVASR